MKSESARRRFRRMWGEIAAFEACVRLLEWDQETCMPPAGVEGRSRSLAALAGAVHDRLCTPELSETVAAAGEVDDDPQWRARVREARRRIHRAVQVPRRLQQELARAATTGVAAWEEAKRRSDFALFSRSLERLVALQRERGAALAGDGDLYDGLLEEYEPGARVADLVRLFIELEDRLGPLVRAVEASGRTVDESPVHGRFPLAAQRQLGLEVLQQLGLDPAAGRLDPAPHPFCLGIHRRDVRITWRGREDDFRPGLLGILHELGHALYEQGLPAREDGTPLGVAVSHSFHEAQARLWENLVGRSDAFWRWLLPRFRELFPAADPDPEGLWRALHTARPGPIRVDADELTYDLHIAIRFELERRLLDGDLAVADLPGAWDELYQRRLGVTPRNAAEGVLQDIHWAVGMFGYFPTYTLGNLIAAQLFVAARRERPDLREAFAAGDFSPLLGWLRRHVHRHGSRYPAPELLRRVTGEELSIDPLVARLEGICAEVYGVAPPGD